MGRCNIVDLELPSDSLTDGLMRYRRFRLLWHMYFVETILKWARFASFTWPNSWITIQHSSWEILQVLRYSNSFFAYFCIARWGPEQSSFCLTTEWRHNDLWFHLWPHRPFKSFVQQDKTGTKTRMETLAGVLQPPWIPRTRLFWSFGKSVTANA